MDAELQPFVSAVSEFLSKYRIVTWLLLGILGVWAIRWQYRLIVNDVERIQEQARYRRTDPRVYLPGRLRGVLTVFLLLSIGIIVEALIRLYQQEVSEFPAAQVLANLVLLLPFVVVFSLKSYLGPIVTVGTFAIIVYNLAYQQAIIVPQSIEAIFDLASSLLPERLEEFYVVFYVAYALATSWRDAQGVTLA